MMNDLDYPYTVRHLEEDEGSGFIIEFPDLPGCMSEGDNLEEAIKNGREAVLAWIEVAKEEGRKIPDPY
jgi:antitoxin HicB